MIYAFPLDQIRTALRDSVEFMGRNPMPVALLSSGRFTVWCRRRELVAGIPDCHDDDPDPYRSPTRPEHDLDSVGRPLKPGT